MNILTAQEKACLRAELYAAHFAHMPDQRLWEVWSGVAPDYGPVAQSRLVEVCEGSYTEVVEYALTKPWFWERNHHDKSLVHEGLIKPFEAPLVRVSRDAQRADRLTKLKQEKRAIEQAIKELLAEGE